jgi:hypothetical protein
MVTLGLCAAVFIVVCFQCCLLVEYNRRTLEQDSKYDTVLLIALTILSYLAIYGSVRAMQLINP